MNDPAECDHDFRRLLYSDISTRFEPKILAVMCCKCGKSPLWLLNHGQDIPRMDVERPWPRRCRITDWTVEDAGTSVEFEIVFHPDTDDGS